MFLEIDLKSTSMKTMLVFFKLEKIKKSGSLKLPVLLSKKISDIDLILSETNPI